VTALFLSTALPLLFAYILTLAPTLPFEDGGEMIRAAFCLGVTHPPGYPLYTLAAKLATLLPVGDLAFRVNFLSAIASACGCGVVACMMARVMTACRVNSRTAWWSALFASLLLGTGPGVWWQSVIAEKYAFNLLMNSLFLASIVGVLTVPRIRAGWLVLSSLAFGLSLSHHGQTVFFVPALAVALWVGLNRLPSRNRGRIAGFAVFAVALGLSLKFIYPPVRAVSHPLHNWADPSTLSRWMDYFSGRQYQYRMFYWGPADLVKRAWEYLVSTLPAQVGWAGLALGIWGFVRLVRGSRNFAYALGVSWLAGMLYCLNFILWGIAIRTYYIPTFLVYCVIVGMGMAGLAGIVGKRWKGAVVPLLVALGLWTGWESFSHRFESDRSRHYFAWDNSKTMLASVAPNALLIAGGDYDLFPLWYTQDVAGYRSGVTVINANFLLFPWAKEERRRLARFYPDGEADWGEKRPDIGDLLKVKPVRPLFVSVVCAGLAKADLIPEGIAYRYAWDRQELLGADVMGEWGRFKRWRTIRGMLDRRVFRDENTRSALTNHAYADYRRGFVLNEQGRVSEACAMFRTSLAWPDFFGLGPAAAHSSLARIYQDRGMTAEAVSEYEAGAKLEPAWIPGLKALGTLYLDQGRYREALATFGRVLIADPADRMAQQNVRALTVRIREKTE